MLNSERARDSGEEEIPTMQGVPAEKVVLGPSKNPLPIWPLKFVPLSGGYIGHINTFYSNIALEN
jgi:hypothetical protein